MLPLLNQTDRSSKYVVIVGSGRLGASLAISLVEEGYSLCILDLNSVAFDLLPLPIVENGSVLPVVGDGTLERHLREISAQDAEIFIAVSGRDVVNALSAQIAKHILQIPRVICRIDDPTRNEMYTRLGLITVSATGLAAGVVLKAAKS